MKVLFVVPRAQFNYKAPWTPLGTISIATFIKQHGHTVRLTDQSFDKESVKEHLDDFAPDAVCVSVISVRVAKDARRLSLLCKERGIPVIWGGFFSADYYKELLLAGMTDYITMGEGEFNTLHLLEALENGTPVRDVRGIAYLENGEPMLTEAQPLADLRDLPVLDFSLCDTENYIHPYLFCKRMMYVYASKGCPGNCAFCSNPTYHCHKYRVRPIDYVIREIKYLYTQYHIDGVYFSDECWYVRREMMQEFCRRLREEKIDIYWGCELRFGICSEEDYRMLYDSGCRWIMFGTESGDPEMLKTIRKHITVDQIRREVNICHDTGIVSILSFIIGYPDERPEQLQNTIDLINGIPSGVNVCNIFTPVPNSEMYDALVRSKQYAPKFDLMHNKLVLIGEHSGYRCNTIPLRDLRVIRSCFMWKGFTKKSVNRESKKFEIAANAIKETFASLTRHGLKGFFWGIWVAAKEFVPIFWYSHFYPAIRKKYKMNRTDQKEYL